MTAPPSNRKNQPERHEARPCASGKRSGCVSGTNVRTAGAQSTAASCAGAAALATHRAARATCRLLLSKHCEESLFPEQQVKVQI